MDKILLLTRNILSEQSFQRKLQELNYEVYCSATVAAYLDSYLDLIQNFDCIIISENFSKKERSVILKKIGMFRFRVYCRVENIHTALQEYPEWTSWMELGESLWTICDKIEGKFNLYEHDILEEAINKPLLKKLVFSNNELKLLECLCQDCEGYFNNASISNYIWQEKSNSRKAQVSNIINSIRKKCNTIGMLDTCIMTLWGKGYRIDKEFLKYLQENKLIA
ncbi:helix-turn-helix domain-containing protein [Enterococcus faecalis]|nr:helix-turn-helix domain-containing protein [Enterococcus faecalis]